ncbi:MAG: BatD family protein [Pseudomonadota bacterium]
MKFRSYISLLLLIICQPLLAKVTVSVDRDPIFIDESFQLVFESDEQIDGQPDFSELKNLLTIINSSNRSSTQIINGKVSHKQQWVLTALADRAGTIDIPSIKFDKTYSPAVKLKVTESAASRKRTKDDVFLETSLSINDPYVQAQVILTIKLYRAIPTSNSTLSDPVISGGQVVIEKLGDDTSYEQQNQGKVYNVVERRYAIFPQNSGKLKIDPVVFQGQTGNTGFFGRDPFGPPARTIVKRSDSLELNVKSIPAIFNGSTWLPAENISIKETWSVSPDALTAGEAVTRTIIIEAKSLAASQIPPAESLLPDPFKFYPDQPEFEQNQTKQSVVGVRLEKMAVIPTKEGSFLLPAIQLPWWNTITDKQEIAELPERQIYVKSTINTPLASEMIDESNYAASLSDNEVNTTQAPTAKGKESSIWQWLTFIFSLLWLLTIIAWYKTNKKTYLHQNQYQTSSVKQLKQAVLKAAQRNDAKATQMALLEWSRINWPDEKINNLHQLKDKIDIELNKELDKLNASLYGQTETQWDSEKFIKLFNSQDFNFIKEKSSKQTLEPLYKT